MAARLRSKHQDEVREKIRASQLINRLHDFVDGKIKMEPAQVTAALGLLKKCVPDLAAVEHTGEVMNYVVEIPAMAESAEVWEQETALQ